MMDGCPLGILSPITYFCRFLRPGRPILLFLGKSLLACSKPLYRLFISDIINTDYIKIEVRITMIVVFVTYRE
jgi:hypothetical protein